MTTATVGFTVRSYFSMIDSGQLDLLDYFTAAGYRLHFAGLPQPLDLAGGAQLIGGIRAAFPDLRHHIRQINEHDGKTVVQINATGTQQGDFQGVPASGRPIAVRSTHTFRFQGNLIAEHWIEVEMAEIMRQISGGPLAAFSGHSSVVNGRNSTSWRKDDVSLLMPQPA